MHGPYTQLINNKTEYTYRSWYRTDAGQPRTPLPYSCVRRQKTGATESEGFPANWRQTIGAITAQSDAEAQYPSCIPSMQTLQYAAYSKFRDKFKEDAQSLLNALEWRQAYNLALSTLKALRRPHQAIGKAMISLAKSPMGRREALIPLKEIPNMWLAWHFGAEPLYQDLHAAYKVLTKPTLDLIRVFAQKKASGDNFQFTNSGYSRTRLTEHVKACVKYCAWMEVTNPNAFMANQLGLLNPVSTMYEAIPWTFLIDKLFPIGPYLSSWTDTIGVKLRIPYTTKYVEAKGYSMQFVFDGGVWRHETARFFDIHWERALAVSLPPPRTLKFPNMSPVNIATFSALAFQPIVAALQHPAVVARRSASPAFWPKWAPTV